MTAPRITVHFAQNIVNRIGTAELDGWGDELRSWHHDSDPNRTFGRDSPNNLTGLDTAARHLHMIPSDDAESELWLRKNRPFDRTSDRLIIYSMDLQTPLTYGLYLLELLGDPGGHRKAFKGGLQPLWEEIAWNHQNGVFSPVYSSVPK